MQTSSGNQLHENDGSFVACACDLELQACGGLPKAAIDALQVALQPYRRWFPGDGRTGRPVA